MAPKLVLALLALAGSMLAAAPAAASNPWLGQRVLNMAHQGGEDENPRRGVACARPSG